MKYRRKDAPVTGELQHQPTTTAAAATAHRPPGQHSLDSLLYIFSQLDLNDCFTCRLVCRSWSAAVGQHFRTLPKLHISYEDSSASVSQQPLPSNALDHIFLQSKEVYDEEEKRVRPRHRLIIRQILSYQGFAHLLALFPSVREFSLVHHPVNDVFLSLLVVFLSRLQHLRLQSCWMHPSVLVERLHRATISSTTGSVNPLWSILSRFTCPAYGQQQQQEQTEKDDASLDYLLDTVHQLQNSDRLSQQLCAFLQDVTGCITRRCAGSAPGTTASTGSAGQISHHHHFQHQHHHHHHHLSAVDLCTQSTLSKWGYHLLVQCFETLSTLSLTNVGLTEETTELLLRQLPLLQELNIADNESIEGHCLQHLGAGIAHLTAGSFNLQVSILNLLGGIVRSAAAPGLRHLELTGCISGNLHALQSLPALDCLQLHFYTDRIISADNFAPFASLPRLGRLQTLVLQQEYCYEERSAVDGDLVAAIVRNCGQLRRLEISGEFGWRLQLNDQSLVAIAEHGRNLRHLLLAGNSTQITDTGVMELARLRHLESLSLTSFEGITDVSISRLVPELVNLRQLCLRENAQLTIRTLDACVEAAAANPQRQLNVHMDEKQMSASQLLVKYATDYLRHTWQRRTPDLPNIEPPGAGGSVSQKKKEEEEEKQQQQQQVEEDQVCRQAQHRRWPPNLNVVIDENLR
ncbi:hypothetical protein TYRP_019946 [Tyrophagus putrescentiae]|nr:hypothetical protein TYRP_019946 [Tyrophagus putrescentiae]